jgi:hypothetical protein
LASRTLHGFKRLHGPPVAYECLDNYIVMQAVIRIEGGDGSAGYGPCCAVAESAPNVLTVVDKRVKFVYTIF